VHTIGRAPDSTLVIGHNRVSARHAEIRWDGRRWLLRDLGSRNGTWHNDQRIAPGQLVPLSFRDRLRFADQDGWFVGNLQAPGATAEALDGGKLLQATGGMLAIPDEADPVACLVSSGRDWIIETADEPARAVTDGEVVSVGGRLWRVRLPQNVSDTWDLTAEAYVAQLALHFAVSLDEEHVQLTINMPGRPHTCRPRAHHYTLLTLARQRLDDQQRSDLPPSEHGWIDQRQLLQMLRLDQNTLYQHIYRSRRELSGLKILDAESIVERRLDAGQLRLGVRDLTVTRDT